MTSDDIRTLAEILQATIRDELSTVTATGGWAGIDEQEQARPGDESTGRACPVCNAPIGRGRPVDAATVWLRYKMTDARNRITGAGGKRSQQYKTWLLLRAFDDGWDMSAFGAWLSGDIERRQKLGQELSDEELHVLVLVDDLYESYRQTVQAYKRSTG